MEIRKHLPTRDQEESKMDWPPRTKPKSRFREIRDKFRGIEEETMPDLGDDPLETSLANRPAFGETLFTERRDVILDLAQRTLSEIVQPPHSSDQ